MVIYLNLPKVLDPPQLKKNINGHYNYMLFYLQAASVFFKKKVCFTKMFSITMNTSSMIQNSCFTYSIELLIVICSSSEHQSSSSEYHSSSSERQSSSSEHHSSSSEHQSSSSERQSSSNDF